MAALEESNPYELHPQPVASAEPGHVHRFVAVGYEQRCIYCHVQEVFALRARVAELEATKRNYEAGFLQLYRESGSRYAAIKSLRQTLANYIALHQWPDEQRGDDDDR